MTPRSRFAGEDFAEAARELALSFSSEPNLANRDHVMSYLTRAALDTHGSRFECDLLTGTSDGLAHPLVDEAVVHYVRWLPRFLAQNALPFRSVVGARLEIEFGLDATRDPDRDGRQIEVPFRCRVTIEDDTGELHVGEVRDTWCIAEEERSVARRFWWQFWRPPR